MVVVSALGATLVILGLCGCNIDTPAGHATITNDEPYAVDVMLCGRDDCGKPRFPASLFNQHYYNRSTLNPGEQWTRINVSTEGVANVYLVVRTSTDTPLGCLPFLMPRPGPNLVARVTQRVPCRGHWNEHRRWPQ
jgi:hypothetical protein